MNCLKCGRETGGDHVFCDHCLEGMESSPVKPGTPVTLPPTYSRLKKRPTEKSEKPETIIARLERKIHRLTTTVMLLILLLAMTAGALVWTVLQDDGPIIGQNYSTMTETGETGN